MEEKKATLKKGGRDTPVRSPQESDSSSEEESSQSEGVNGESVASLPSSRRWHHLSVHANIDISNEDENLCPCGEQQPCSRHSLSIQQQLQLQMILQQQSQAASTIQVQRDVTLSGYVGLHDFSRLVKPSHRNPLVMDKGRVNVESVLNMNHFVVGQAHLSSFQLRSREQQLPDRSPNKHTNARTMQDGGAFRFSMMV